MIEMPLQRISDDTRKHLLAIQQKLKEQKGERHTLVAIAEKLILNADYVRMYGLKPEDSF